jgi:hypothetical protein
MDPAFPAFMPCVAARSVVCALHGLAARLLSRSPSSRELDASAWPTTEYRPAVFQCPGLDKPPLRARFGIFTIGNSTYSTDRFG